MKILGISGRKQSGKNTTANILHGIVLKEQGLIEAWSISDKGKLLIKTEVYHKGSDGWGEFDIERKDNEFVDYAESSMWPYVKLYSFADSLKSICVDLFEIPPECVYGTDEQKNQLQEHLLWENMPGVITSMDGEVYSTWDILDPVFVTGNQTEPVGVYHPSGPMTAREFMQYLGTDIMRRIFEPIWLERCLKIIQQEQPELAVIGDVRFPNEGMGIEQLGGSILRLARRLGEDQHSSENAMDEYPCRFILDNQDKDMDFLVESIVKFYHTELSC